MSEPSAVLEAPARPPLKVLHALMQMKQEEYDQLRETHAALWQKRKSATLDRNGYIDYLMAEDRMALLLQEMEQLTPQVLFAEAHEAITSGKAHYDALVPAVTEAATLLCQRWAAFV